MFSVPALLLSILSGLIFVLPTRRIGLCGERVRIGCIIPGDDADI